MSTLPYRKRFVEFSSVYALRWNKVIDCRDRIGRVGRLCKCWLTVLVDLSTGCSRRLLLHEYNVYLLICFAESMATQSVTVLTKLAWLVCWGKVVKGSAVSSKPSPLLSSQTFRLTTMRHDADITSWWSDEMHDHSSLMNVSFSFYRIMI